MGEFDRIARFLHPFPRAKVPQGPGDDCAVVRPRLGTELCVTTDALVEDVHFTRRTFSPGDIGHKALAVNLSDLASMGARPAWFLCALELPPWVDDRILDGIALGMSALSRSAGIALLGGNVSRSSQLALTLTAAGEVPRGKALRRGGGRPGDLLYVSGALGEARLGLELLGQDPSSRAAAATRQRRPIPRIGLGLLARRHASAGIDLSDGLAQDLGHLCRASGVGAQVELSRLPLGPALRRAKGEGAEDFAAAGGEDYELLLAVPPKKAPSLERACRPLALKLTPIGELTSGRSVVFLGAGGEARERPTGFDHFAQGGLPN